MYVPLANRKENLPLTLNGVLETGQLKEVWDIFRGTFPVVIIANFLALISTSLVALNLTILV